MIHLSLTNRFDVMISICLVIISFYFLKKLFIYKFIDPKKKNSTNAHHNDKDDDDDDYLFRFNIDKRSLRPSYTRFMRRKLQQELTNDSNLCIVCCNERKNIVLLPCRHLCICAACSKKLYNNISNQTCPMCRNPIENRLEVFI